MGANRNNPGFNPGRGTAIARALAIAAVIAVGLAIDARGEPWSQPLVNAGIWLFLLYVAWRETPRMRVMLLACVAYSWAGEIALSPFGGLYAYRLSGVPFFVPPGHALLLTLGMILAARAPTWLPGFVAAASGPVVLAFGISGIDTSALLLYALFLGCVAWGPSPRLYAVMFVLSLAMEIYGVWLGNWGWSAEAIGLTFNNPPLAAGTFYCVLDWLVGLHSQAAPRTPLESPCTGGESRVSTRSENTYLPHRAGTPAYKVFTLDIPPPSTMTSGSRMLMTPASDLASRAS